MNKPRWAGVVVAVCLMMAGGCGTVPSVPPTSTPKSPEAVPSPARKETRALRVSVMDETSGPLGKLDKVEIWVRNHGSWRSDLRHGGDVRTLGEFEVGKTYEADFYIYPDGRDGAEIRVPFRMTADMISGSDRDTVLVDILDHSVRVTGTAVIGVSQEFPR